jgi:APA family basic amino acid/polyamine antiporter
MDILYKFSFNNIVLSHTIAILPTSTIINQTILLTLWGFIGLESATAPAGLVANPGRTIPLAIISGTATVAALYVFNSISVMGAMPSHLLTHSIAPYADAVQAVFGGNWHLLISLISGIVCLSTLNAWTLTSGQIALGLAQRNMLPTIFTHTTAQGAPFWPLIVSCLGTIPLLLMLSNASLAAQVTTIIDFSVTSFLFVYVSCCAALIKFLWHKKSTSMGIWTATISALLFCVWIILHSALSTLLIATLFTATGIPMYWYQRTTRRNKHAF